MASTIELSRGKDGVDTRQLRQLTKDFKDWKPDKQLKLLLRDAGNKIKTDARQIVIQPSEYSVTTNRHKPTKRRTSTGRSKGSTSVPPTIKVRVSKTRVSVVAGGDRVPLGGLLEMGNRHGGKSGAAARSGAFRHPVFGDKNTWTYQAMHPFLLPAAEKNKRSIEALEGKAVAESFREYRFPMSAT